MDCVVTEWSQWTPCSQSCSNKNSEGRQSRTRSVLALPGQGGKPCPPPSSLQEYRLCNEHSCNQLYWETSAWSLCSENALLTTLNTTINWNNKATCGVGIQTRRVFCLKNNSGQVPAKRCPESIKPETVRSCLLPCKKDCVVTPFSEWTRCPTICQHGSSFKKHLMEEQSARTPYLKKESVKASRLSHLQVNWKIHKWGQCLLVPDSVRQGILGINEACGPGLQSR
ncbi:hypothetical protein E2320_020345, partial [Naja naja]